MNKINNKTLGIFSAITLALSLIGFSGFLLPYFVYGNPITLFELFLGFMGIVLPILMTVFFAKYNADNAIKYTRILLILTLVYQLLDTIYHLGIHSMLRFLIGFPFLICIIIAVFSSLTKSKNKKFIIIAIAIGILYKVLSVPTILSLMIRHLSHGSWLFLLSLPCEWAGITGFYTLFILFCLNSGVADFKPSSKPQKKAQALSQPAMELSPEQQLKALKEKADLGIITQEEYQAQRAQIISKL